MVMCIRYSVKGVHDNTDIQLMVVLGQRKEISSHTSVACICMDELRITLKITRGDSIIKNNRFVLHL